MAEQGCVVQLESASGIPFYRQIIQQIEYAVDSRKLAPGERLPTIRALAITLKINPNTIAKAYAELEIRGVVKTQVGCGTFVLEKHADGNNSTDGECRDTGGIDARISRAAERFVSELASVGIPPSKAVEIITSFLEERL